jgi:hypothetical protein
MGKLKRWFIRLAEYVFHGIVYLGGMFLFLDWWVSTESEFMSTSGEKLFMLIYAPLFLLWLWFIHRKESKNSGKEGKKGVYPYGKV